MQRPSLHSQCGSMYTRWLPLQSILSIINRSHPGTSIMCDISIQTISITQVPMPQMRGSSCCGGAVPTKLHSLLTCSRGAGAYGQQSHDVLPQCIAHDARGMDWTECDLLVICHRRRHWRGYGTLNGGGLQLSCSPMWNVCNSTLSFVVAEHGASGNPSRPISIQSTLSTHS